MVGSTHDLAPDGTRRPTPDEREMKQTTYQLQQLDTNGDGKLSHKEMQADIKADTDNIRAESCETSIAPIKADKAFLGMTDVLAFSEGNDRSVAEKFLATSLSKEYNQILDTPIIKQAFPNGTAHSVPKDFLKMAKEIGNKIQECGFITPEPFLDEPNREYVQRQNLPTATAALNDKAPKR